jgi:hypothetical protein
VKLPKRGSKEYREIVLKGCHSFEDDCDHGYTWICEYCPVIENLNSRQKDSVEMDEKIDEFMLDRQPGSQKMFTKEDMLNFAVSAHYRTNLTFYESFEVWLKERNSK